MFWVVFQAGELKFMKLSREKFDGFSEVIGFEAVLMAQWCSKLLRYTCIMFFEETGVSEVDLHQYPRRR